MEDELVSIEINCGCYYLVPASISNDMDAVESYLFDEHKLLTRQVSPSRFDVVCSICHSTIERDI